MTEALDQSPGTVAIVGLAGRLPGASDVETFWSNLAAGRESVRTFTRAELLEAGIPEEVVDDPAYVPAAGIPGDVAGLDLELFRMNRAEAEVIDPQHRLFLECAWEALEDAGSMLPDGERRTGVFASTDFNMYLLEVIAPRLGKVGAATEFQVELGNDKDFLATRVSYKLDLNGPAVVVQTGCSSSLVAVHLACESLLSGGCDVAVAGGSRLHVPLVAGHFYHEGGASSSEPHCRAFDAAASGTVRGNGAAAVVLKRTEDALADGDHVYAVVLGSAINNDGADKVGFTAPSVRGQRAVIREALAVAGVEPGDVSYVETHGTGTVLGDPIELAALADALEGRRADRQPCVLGAVKTNIGHMGSASGVAGLVKAALAVERELIPGTLHFTTPNPELRLEETRFVISPDAVPWERGPAASRVAGVSSFGIGGTNCHVVLGEPPVRPLSEADGEGPELVVLSAATPSALRASATNTARALEQEDLRLEDVAKTLQVGRRSLPYRWARVAGSTAAAAAALREVAGSAEAEAAGGAPVCMLLPGQGAEFAGMALDTMRRNPSFAKDMEHGARLLREQHDIDLHAFLETGELPEDRARTAVVQPVLFTLEHCLVQLWTSWGITPAAVVGHSLGEFSAAAVAGVFSFEDGLRLTAARGRVMAAMPPGAMTAVRAGEAALRPILPDGVAIAGLNAPGLTVAAGRVAGIEELERRLAAEEIGFVRVPVDRAFHTTDVEAVSGELEDVLQDVALRAPRIPCYSNSTGRPLTAEEARSPAYWVGQAANPVRFMDCILDVAETGAAPWFLEVGPGAALGRFTRETLGDRVAGRVLPTLGKSPAAERKTLLDALGSLWQAGATVDWERVARPAGSRKARLPTYPFERRRCWFGEGRGADVPPPPPPAVERAAAEAPPAPPPTDEGGVVEEVKAIVGDVTGMEPALELPFVEQGLESLALLEVAEKIRQRFGLRVSLPQLLEDFTTVEALAAHLVDEGAAAGPPAASRAEPEPVQVEPAVPEPAAPQAPGVAPFAPPQRETRLSDAEAAYLERFVPKYVGRTARSKAYNERYRPVHADPRNSAGFRSAWKEVVYPIVADRAEGASIWDLDGNRYVDLTMAFGVALFGHSPPFVREALAEQLERSIAVGPQTAGSGVVAERLCRLTGFDRAVFTNSGTEAVMAALRLARAATRRDRVVLFRGSYHGTYDGVLARPGRPGSGSSVPAALGVPRSLVSDVVVLDYATEDVFELLEAEGERVAAVLVEPVQSRNPALQARDYLHRLRDATRGVGALLVLDEMITGFRSHAGGVNSLWCLDADAVAYGKVLGGGLPIGAVAGRAAALDLVDGGAWRYGDDSRPDGDLTFFAGTFCKHPLAMAAADAVLAELERRGPALQQELSERTAALARGLRRILGELELPVAVEDFTSQLGFRSTGSDLTGELFFKELILRGVYVWEGRTSFLSTAHSEQDVEEILAAAEGSARELADALAGPHVRRTAPAAARAPREPATFPCRDEQRLLWLGMEMDPGAAGAYNEVLTITGRGAVDDAIVAETVRLLVERNDALRIRIDPTGASQWVAEDADCELGVVDVGDGADRWDRARELVAALRETRFDLVRGPVVRATLLHVGQQEHVVVVVAPHLVVDGWSLSVLGRQFEETYASLLAGDPPVRVGPRFEDFVRWERRRLADGGPAEAYWRGRLRGVDPSPMLPGSPAAARVYEARKLRRVLDEGTARRLPVLCSARRTTPFVVGLGAWCAALAATTGRDDVVVTITPAGQPEIGQFDLVGYCLKVLPIRIRSESQPFGALVDSAQAAVAEAREHWAVEESALIEEFWTPRDPARPPMGGVNFQYERPERPVAVPGTTALEIDLVGRSLTKWDATMVLVDSADGLAAELAYTALHDDGAAALIDEYVAILERGCNAPSAPVRDEAVAPGPRDVRRVPVALAPAETSD